MAQRSVTTFNVDASPDRVLEVLSGPDFEIAQQAGQDGNQSCTYHEISRDDDRLVYELHTVEYARGLTGIDRSKTERSTTVVTWDLKKRASQWTYTGPHGKRARVTGSSQIRAKGEGTEVHSEFNIEIKIPLVGGKIEKLVAKATDKHWSVFAELAREHAQR